MRYPRRLALSMLVLLSSGSLAMPADQAAVRDEIDATLMRLIDQGRLNVSEETALVVEQPAQVHRELGAVVDVRRPADGGLPVLAVTPGGAADRMGLQVGDRLLAVNGHRFDAGSGRDALARAVAAENGDLRIEAMRAGAPVVLEGSADIRTLPAYRISIGNAVGGDARNPGTDGCGRISLVDSAPRGRHVYPARLIAVGDGGLPGPSNAESYRLPVGRHTLTVAEAIDPVQFDTVSRFQRDRRGRERYKTIEIDVEADTTYRLGAQFHLDRRRSIRDNAYWDPVIWNQLGERCR